MTRGTLSVIVNGKDGKGYQIWQSNEFNGQMFIQDSSAGNFVYEYFPQIDQTVEDLDKLTNVLNRLFFNYPEEIIKIKRIDYPREPNPESWTIPDDYLDLTTWKYMSDYTFLRNWSDRPITVKIPENKSIQIVPGSGVVFYFDELYSPDKGASNNWIELD